MILPPLVFPGLKIKLFPNLRISLENLDVLLAEDHEPRPAPLRLPAALDGLFGRVGSAKLLRDPLGIILKQRV